MPHLDPFFEDYKVLKAYSAQVELGRRTTKRLLVYGKRDFLQMSVEEEGRRRKRRWRGLGLEGAGGGGHQPREWLSASLSLPEAVQRDPASLFHALSQERPGYTRCVPCVGGGWGERRASPCAPFVTINHIGRTPTAL
jgi:hypothetical protein